MFCHSKSLVNLVKVLLRNIMEQKQTYHLMYIQINLLCDNAELESVLDKNIVELRSRSRLVLYSPGPGITMPP